jgi:glycogen operon protein
MLRFTERLGAIRHRLPPPRRFLHGKEQVLPGIADIEWFDERGAHLSDADWSNVEGRALILYLSKPGDPAQVSALAMNASGVALEFHLLDKVRWRMLLDSTAPEREETALEQPLYRVEPHAAVMFEGLASV